MTQTTATFTDELGIDVNEAIDASNTQPDCDVHSPEPEVGDYLIPFYPDFLISPSETDSSVLETAWKVYEADVNAAITPNEDFTIEWDALEQDGDTPLVVIDGRQKRALTDTDYCLYIIGSEHDV